MEENKQSFTVKLADDIKKGLGINDIESEELTTKIIDSIQRAAEVAKSISNCHLKCFNEGNKAKYLLIGEQCMNLETHWILNWRNVGFRASILRICSYLEISINDQEALYKELAKKKILVSDSRELPLSSSSYNNKICPDFNFNNWKKEVEPKVDDKNRLTVVFVYNRIFQNFKLNKEAQDWLKCILRRGGEVYVLIQSRPEKFSKVSCENGKFDLQEVKKDDDLLAELS